ncbi:hypothetical protein [Nocardia lijiangensis]|uniref:hypothetical protein n=1 Tax=Nocardia lijiangensis TaxID=299618 RepID=UPI003D73FB90
MSGFTRDACHYGDQLVYEALHSKWGRHHANYCGCGQDWIITHAERAGFTVVRAGGGFTALTGPGLTEDVDEGELTTNVLWEGTGIAARGADETPGRAVPRLARAAARKLITALVDNR